MAPLQKTLTGSTLGLCVGLAAYAVLLFILIGAVPGGSDNSGYFNEARLFASGRIRAPMRTLEGVPAQETPFLYVPLGFKPAMGADAQLVPTYPPGLPLMLVSAAALIGWQHAGDLVLLLHSLAGIALVFALAGACGLSGTWALVGAAILAASPLYLFTSLQALSDVPATVWATAAVVAALRSRERRGWALASGLCIAVGFLVRPSNFLVALPVLVAVGMSPRGLALVALGALPGVAAWMAINDAAYGHILESGYGAIGNEFHRSLVMGTVRYYAHWLPLLLSPVVLLSPAIIAFSRATPRVVAVLATWAAGFLAFYASYRWTHEQWWFLRFILPAAPALIVAGLAAVSLWLEGLKARYTVPWAALVPAVVLLCALGVEAGQGGPIREARAIGHGERKYGRVSVWLSAHLPKDAVLVASQSSGALFYFSDFTILRYEEMRPPVSEQVRLSVERSGRGLYAVLWPFETGVLEKLPGTWTQVGAIDDVTVWKCDGSSAAAR
jgi:hypothetical protein